MSEVENGPDLWLARFPWPDAAAHKHRRGRLGVVSGPMSRTGAARLAARAGLRIGAGLVTVLSPPDAVLVNASHLEAIMLKAFGSPEVLVEASRTFDAVVIGPAAGVGEGTALNVEALKRDGRRLVLDADALTSFEGGPGRLFVALGASDVLTPHEGEFERLWPGLLGEGRAEAVSNAALACGAVLVLKGPETLIAAPEGRLALNPNGTPWLATAGTGDVLAGMIGGLIAQGMDSFDAACAAVWIHAEAARDFGPGLISEDLPDLLPGVMRRLNEKGPGA